MLENLETTKAPTLPARTMSSDRKGLAETAGTSFSVGHWEASTILNTVLTQGISYIDQHAIHVDKRTFRQVSRSLVSRACFKPDPSSTSTGIDTSHVPRSLLPTSEWHGLFRDSKASTQDSELILVW